MSLNILFNLEGSTKNRKRVGRGIGTGKGKTCGRGTKGQKSRSGVSTKNASEQTSLYKKLPKRGFNCDKSIRYSLISLSDLEMLVDQARIDASKTISKRTLLDLNLIKNIDVKVKLLGGVKNIKIPLTIELDAYSKSASEVVKAAGGKVV